MNESDNSGDFYLAMWDCNGLEFLYNLTRWEKAKVWRDLGGTINVDPPPDLRALLLRAQHNTQRHYEIYTFTVTTDISYDDLVQQFTDSPQAMVDLIRSRGNCVHSDRSKKKPAIV